MYEIITLRSVYDDQSLGTFPDPIPKVLGNTQTVFRLTNNLQEYSHELERLLLSLIAKDPQQRPTVSLILEDPLLQPDLAKINTESEIYGELQQRYITT